MSSATEVRALRVGAFTVPTDGPESDGTLAWDSTTIVVVQADGGDATGLGYAYADAAAAGVVHRVLTPVVIGLDTMATSLAWIRMIAAVRNIGRAGIAAGAIAAVDAALWDLKARTLDLALCDLLGPVRPGVDVYGSGGFTSYDLRRLAEQLAGWASQGIRAVKMKVGREPAADVARVAAARAAVGDEVELFVDANGAYTGAQACGLAAAFADLGVTWFEEPVSSDDLDGLAGVRAAAPPGMDVAAGEYGYDIAYFERMLAAGAVDVLQADATRCGITGMLQAASACQARSLPLSAHTAPSVHAHVGVALAPLRHVELFHDHVRIEQLLFDGAPVPIDGRLVPDRGRPGNGLTFKWTDAERWASP